MSASSDDTVDVSGFIEHDRQLEPVGPAAPPEPPSITDLHAENQDARLSLPNSYLSTPPEIATTTQFTEAYFWNDYLRRVKHEQDILILVSDYQNDRGTGKTVLSIDLGEKLDRTDRGLTESKATTRPQEFINAYTDEVEQSSLILDEAEAGIGAREAMTKINRLLSEIVSMGRVEQKYCILNMPASNHIDKNIIDLAHYWVLVQRKGLARVYQLKNNPFEQKKYPKPVQRLQWSDIGGNHPVYRALTKQKRSRLRNPSGDGSAYVPQEEHREALEKREKEVRQAVRDQIIANIIQDSGVQLSQSTIGNLCLGMSQSHVSSIKQQLKKGDFDGLGGAASAD